MFAPKVCEELLNTFVVCIYHVGEHLVAIECL